MQANGQLRRPLWDVIKSIGGGSRRAHAQRRGLRTQRIRDSPDRRGPERPAAAVGRPTQDRQRWNGIRGAARRGGRESEADPGADAGRCYSGGAVGPDVGDAKGTTAAGAHRDVATGEVAPNEDQASAQASASAVRIVVDHKYDSEAQKRRPAAGHVEAEQDDGVFEAVIQRAVANPTDYKTSRWPTLKEDEQLRPRYFKAYHSAIEHRMRKQAKRWEIARSRFGLGNARNWRSTLDLLDQATPDGETRHKRRMETVTMSDGLRGTWKKNAGEVVLEIMQRTGAHVQALPPVGKDGSFTGVSLWGTPAQNEHARLVLPKFVDAADEVLEPVNVYELNPQVAQDKSAALAIFGSDSKEAIDSAYWREHDTMEDAEIELLEDALGDITNAPPQEPAPIRSVWAPTTINIRSRPAKWNQITFSAYVDALTSSIPRLAQRKLYGPLTPQSTQAHVETMTAELVHIFTNRESRRFASSAALDIATRFFMKHNNLPAARSVFTELENREFDFTASNFDVFFEVAAREESVPNFLYTLRRMLSKGIRPTARTWCAFHLLMSRRFPLEANMASEKMRKKGFFGDIDIVRAVAAGNADRATAAHLTTDKSVEEFMFGYEATYGEPAIWLSARFVNKMSRVLLERGRTEDALNVVRQLEAIARERGRQGATTSTLNTFLASCSRDGNMHAALAYLRAFMPPLSTAKDARGPSMAPIGRFADDKLAIQPNHITYGILFGIASRARYYNVARALWRHACALGMVSFRMQHAVHQSLKRPAAWVDLSDKMGSARAEKEISNAFLTERSLWGGLAGKFVVGVGTGMRGASESTVGDVATYSPSIAPDGEAATSGDGLSERWTPYQTIAELDSSNVAAATSDAATPRFGKVRRGQKARELLTADLDEAGSIQPVNLLLHDLERAWRLDMVWKEEGVGKVSRVNELCKAGEGDEKVSLNAAVALMLEEMLKRGVRVPMAVGDVAGVRDAEGLAALKNRHQGER